MALQDFEQRPEWLGSADSVSIVVRTLMCVNFKDMVQRCTCHGVRPP